MSSARGLAMRAARPGGSPEGWHVRPAVAADVAEIAAAIAQLLVELGGTPPEPSAMAATARKLLDDPSAGIVLVAEAQDDATLVGVLAASLQTAIHAAGRYALIQDLWVDPEWRSRAIGAALLDALVALARDARVQRIEVGLPRETFANLAATAAFYRRNGFEPLGPRMRRMLDRDREDPAGEGAG